MVRIVVADGRDLVRSGAKLLLAAVTGFHVVEDAADAPRAVEAVHGHDPDVLVLGQTLPELGGLEVCRRLSERKARTRTLLLVRSTLAPDIARALRAGAHGCLSLECPRKELETAVRAVAAGRTYLGSAMPRDAVAKLLRTKDATALDPLATLTPREREVLPLAADGWRNVEIGRHLGISTRTVEIHRANLMRKLGLRAVPDLIRWARVNGVVRP